MFRVFLFALIFAVEANGVVMASNNVMHQKNCIYTSTDASPTTHAHQGHAHDHDTADNATPEHDHETSMMDACSEITCEAFGTVEIPIFPSATLTASEHELTALKRVENLLRPPIT